MDDENYQQLVARFPADLLGHVRLLYPDGIPDPWLVDQDHAYTSCLDRIELAVRAYLSSFEANAQHH
jgi:hypothetical protein